MNTYKILFLGDIVGKPGRDIVHQGLPILLDQHKPLFTIANGENSAGGVGITSKIADDLFKIGVDVITLGNHAFDKKDIASYLDMNHTIIRPDNMSQSTPGSGMTHVLKDDITLNVINLCGRVFMGLYDDPFTQIDELIQESHTPHIFLDFHAEATSEKLAMGHYVDGRVTAVIGTHTHVTTADEQILPGGTAYLTDVGMCGPKNSIIGVRKELALQRFITSMHVRFEVAEDAGYISAVMIEADRDTGQALNIERVFYE